MPPVLIPCARALARALWALRLRDLGGRLAFAAWRAEVKRRGGPSVR